MFNIYVLTGRCPGSPPVDSSSRCFSLFSSQEGQTALHQAAQAGHHDTVAALILGGCDVGIQDFVSFYHLNTTTIWPRRNVTKTSSHCLYYGIMITIQYLQSGHTALQKAASEGHVDIVSQLLKQGASVDHQDEVVSSVTTSDQLSCLSCLYQDKTSVISSPPLYEYFR